MAHGAFGLCALRGGIDDDTALARRHAHALADCKAGDDASVFSHASPERSIWKQRERPRKLCLWSSL